MVRKNLLPPDEIVTLLEAHPGVLADVSADVPIERLHARPTESVWSAHENLLHLWSCAAVWGDRFQVMLDEESPSIRAVHPDRWLETAEHGHFTFRTLLADFTAKRLALLATISAKGPAEWQRSARVTGGGHARTVSVHFQLDLLARHERSHVRQIGKLVGRR